MKESKGKIVCVDDEKAILELLQAILEVEGYEVLTINDSREVIQSTLEFSPDLFILDFNMPHINGIELSGKIKDEKAFKDIPFLFVTGNAEEGNLSSCFDAGASDYISKPFYAHELLARVHACVSSYRSQRTILALNNTITEKNQELEFAVRAYQKLYRILEKTIPKEVFEQAHANIATGYTELYQETVERSFLFLDVVGFTSYSDNARPEEVIERLNQVLGPATDWIYKHKGDVNKFIGDSIFAVFQKPQEAFFAARDILKESKLAKDGFQLRIGIHNGHAIRCNVGSSERSEHTYIGKDVNLASRLEGLCNPGELVVSDSFLQLVKDTGDFRFCSEQISVKGFVSQIQIHRCKI